MGPGFLRSRLVPAGGLALVGTVLMAAYFTNEMQGCSNSSSEAQTCSYFVDAPEDKILKKRGDSFMKDQTTWTNSDVKDFRPEYSYNYSACSGITGTGLVHKGTPVANQWCAALGCNYKQCVQFRVKCDQSTGQPTSDYIDNGVLTPDIQCVAARNASNMTPGAFVAILFAFLISISMCVMGCVAGAAY